METKTQKEHEPKKEKGPKKEKKRPERPTGTKRKRSKNDGVWDNLSPKTKKRYLSDAPSPDPLIRQFEMERTVRATAQELNELFT